MKKFLLFSSLLFAALNCAYSSESSFVAMIECRNEHQQMHSGNCTYVLSRQYEVIFVSETNNNFFNVKSIIRLANGFLSPLPSENIITDCRLGNPIIYRDSMDIFLLTEPERTLDIVDFFKGKIDGSRIDDSRNCHVQSIKRGN